MHIDTRPTSLATKLFSNLNEKLGLLYTHMCACVCVCVRVPACLRVCVCACMCLVNIEWYESGLCIR